MLHKGLVINNKEGWGWGTKWVNCGSEVPLPFFNPFQTANANMVHICENNISTINLDPEVISFPLIYNTLYFSKAYAQ